MTAPKIPTAASRAAQLVRTKRWQARNPEKRRANHLAWERGRRALLHTFKNVPCMDCGNTFDPVCMDFDHRPGEVKLFNVAGGYTGPLDALIAEIAKCDVVCANCHRLRTHRHRDHRATCSKTKPIGRRL